MAETLAEKLDKIERGDQRILEMFQGFLKSGDDMHISDFVLIGALKRTLALSEGFRGHIKEKNFTCAAALLRLQLDTALRLYAALLCDSAEKYAKAVFDGTPVNKIKDRDGKLLTDSYLAKKISEENAWVEPMYKQLCDFVHFSNRHIFSSIAKTNDEERIVHFQISAKDPPRPDEDYFEIVEAYYATMRLSATIANGWKLASRTLRAQANHQLTTDTP